MLSLSRRRTSPRPRFRRNPGLDTIRTKIDLSHISRPGDVLAAILGKQQAQREIVVCMHCRLRQFVTSNGLCRRCRRTLFIQGRGQEKVGILTPTPHPPPAPPARALRPHFPAGTVYIPPRATSTVSRVETSSAVSKAHITQIPLPRVIMPQTGPRPVYTAKATLNGVKRETSTRAQPEQKSAQQDAIEQAEEALKALRTQEKQGGSSGSKE